MSSCSRSEGPTKLTHEFFVWVSFYLKSITSPVTLAPPLQTRWASLKYLSLPCHRCFSAVRIVWLIVIVVWANEIWSFCLLCKNLSVCKNGNFRKAWTIASFDDLMLIIQKGWLDSFMSKFWLPVNILLEATFTIMMMFSLHQNRVVYHHQVQHFVNGRIYMCPNQSTGTIIMQSRLMRSVLDWRIDRETHRSLQAHSGFFHCSY